MIQQTVFSFKIETTKERLTAHGGLALMAEFNHGIGSIRTRVGRSQPLDITDEPLTKVAYFGLKIPFLNLKSCV